MKYLAAFILILFWFVELVTAAQPQSSTDIGVLVYWDQNPETDIAEYKLYGGPESGNYDTTLSILPGEKKDIDGKQRQFKEFRLPLGVTRFFVVTAINEARLESLPSNEVSITTPSAPTAPVFPIILIIDESGNVLKINADQITE